KQLRPQRRSRRAWCGGSLSGSSGPPGRGRDRRSGKAPGHHRIRTIRMTYEGRRTDEPAGDISMGRPGRRPREASDAGRGGPGRRFIERHTFWAFVILVAAALFLWPIVAAWPEWVEGVLGRKKTFVNTLLNGLTLGGLYFRVASGFTLIFGLMRN